MANNQKKKKKKAGDSISSSCLIPVVDLDDDLVVYQILSRLPVKSLMRFKCVCKAWKSIIERDSHLIDSHYAHSQGRRLGLFIAPNCEYKNKILGFVWRFFSAELHCDDDEDSDGGRIITGATIHISAAINCSGGIRKCLGPVRGLLCLVDSGDAVQIYNARTGQAVTPWIRSAVVMKRKNYGAARVQFGFDRNTGKHKVISVRNGRKGAPGVCEVLTVGVDASCRIIDDVPPCKAFKGSNVCANGSVYWSTRISDEGFLKCLMAFDCGSEKFRVIKIPRFDGLERAPLPYKIRLLEMDGCLTVECVRHRKKRSHTVKMWKFHEEDWSEVTIELPPCVQPENSCMYPIPGMDTMILEAYNPPKGYRFRNNVKFASFYSYNMVNKTFSKFELQGIEKIPGNGETVHTIFAESLFYAGNTSEPS